MGIVLHILPPPSAVSEVLRRAVFGVNDQFAHIHEIVHVAYPEHVTKDYHDLQGWAEFGVDLTTQDRVKLKEIDITVIPVGLLSSWSADLKRLYTQAESGTMTLMAPWTSRADLPDFDQHVFGRLGEKMTGALRYFPYGFFTQNPGMGRQDAFGHRISEDIRMLGRRPKSHIVVAVFGGSAAYGHGLIVQDTFAAKLNERLSADPHVIEKNLKISVVNFSQEAALVLNQTMSFTLFCHRLRPDIVISHDGWNDLANGALDDPWLVSQHDITYNVELERWGQYLQGHVDVPVMDLNHPLVQSPVHAVVRAYIARKKFFADMVLGLGGCFVAGFQPAAFSKPQVTEEEQNRIDIDSRQKPALQDLLGRRMPVLYEMASSDHDKTFVDWSVNFHTAFAALVSGQHFLDRVHTLPAADRVIADAYYEKIRLYISKAWAE